MATAATHTVQMDTPLECHEPSAAELWAIVREQRSEIDRLRSMIDARSDLATVVPEDVRRSLAAPRARALRIRMPRAPRFAIALALMIAVVCGGSAALASTNGSRFDHGCYTPAAGHTSTGTAGACPADTLSGK